MEVQERPGPSVDDATPVVTYLVECFWPGVTRGRVESAASLVQRQASARCLELILVPGDEIVLGVFQGPSHAAVSEACRLSGLPCERIVETVLVGLAGDVVS